MFYIKRKSLIVLYVKDKKLHVSMYRGHLLL